jgi:hypothetical protein
VSSDLPYVDEHAVTIAAPRDRVWAALRQYATTSIGVPGGHPLARILGTDPRSGFRVAETVPGTRLTLAGRHRFSRYTLVFELRDAAPAGPLPPDSTVPPDSTLPPDITVLTATTRAAFPGARGQAYRALVIGTRAHVLATRHMLRAVRRLSLAER